MTDEQFLMLTRDLQSATLTTLQSKQLKELLDLAVLRGAQPAVLRPRTRVTHDGHWDDK